MEDNITLKRIQSCNEDFIALVKELDEYLKGINGEEHDFFNQFNTLDLFHHMVVCYVEDTPVGTGAFKVASEETVEIKRMYVKPNYRGKNLATNILKELEKWARELRFENIVLETSKDMLPALNLYRKNGYDIIPNFQPYKGIASSVCFKKKIGLNMLT